jgi:hypothetical protein
MLIQNKAVDSPTPPREILIDSDWSAFRSMSVEENYDTNGVRSARFTNELESYKVAQ